MVTTAVPATADMRVRHEGQTRDKIHGHGRGSIYMRVRPGTKYMVTAAVSAT
jgi:hypothetical protein